MTIRKDIKKGMNVKSVRLNFTIDWETFGKGSWDCYVSLSSKHHTLINSLTLSESKQYFKEEVTKALSDKVAKSLGYYELEKVLNNTWDRFMTLCNETRPTGCPNESYYGH